MTFDQRCQAELDAEAKRFAGIPNLRLIHPDGSESLHPRLARDRIYDNIGTLRGSHDGRVLVALYDFGSVDLPTYRVKITISNPSTAPAVPAPAPSSSSPDV